MVSVVIPFYKNYGWLCEAIDSVIAQTYKNYEIIIVNDGSEEDVSSLQIKYPIINYYYQENNGAGSARNLGIDVSKGKYIAFLDSDDLWLPTKLEKQVSYMEDNPQIQWSHCSYQTFGFGDDIIVPVGNTKGHMFPKCLASCRIATPCVIIRRSVLIDNSDMRFNVSMRYGQDFYLWVLLCKNYELGYIDEVLANVRMRGTNAAKRAYVMLKAKSEMTVILRNKNLIEWKRLPFLTRSAYRLCVWGFRVISFFEKRNYQPKFLEFMSKILYLIPYIFLKIERIRTK